MSYEVESKTLPGGHRVAVVYDEHPESPREWDNLGTVVLVDRCRYNFGDEQADQDELRRIGLDEELLKLPIYLYDHSGITINTSGFSCPWDSGMVGMIYMTKQTAIENWGKKILTKAVRDKAYACLRAEIECLDQYLTGQVYAYRVYDPEGKELDSCYGFFGPSEDCLEEGLAVAEYHEQEAEKNKRAAWRAALHEARQVRYWAARDIQTTATI
jgi:hypothetical protein